MKLLQTNDYLLFIDKKAEIKEYFDGYVYQPHWKKPVKLEDSSISLNYAEEDRKEYGGGKIIAYRKLNEEAKELDLPELPKFTGKQNPLLYALEKVLSFEKRGADKGEPRIGSGILSIIHDSIKEYEDIPPKQFTLEDMKKAFEEGGKHRYVCEANGKDKKCYCRNDNECNFASYITSEEYIQSLSTQQSPKEFIPEYEIGAYPSTGKQAKRLKTITNSEGKEVLVGTYKY